MNNDGREVTITIESWTKSLTKDVDLHQLLTESGFELMTDMVEGKTVYGKYTIEPDLLVELLRIGRL